MAAPDRYDFDVEHDIDGGVCLQRQALGQVGAARLVASLETWMGGEHGKLSRHADVAKAMDTITRAD